VTVTYVDPIQRIARSGQFSIDGKAHANRLAVFVTKEDYHRIIADRGRTRTGPWPQQQLRGSDQVTAERREGAIDSALCGSNS
jgi:hypothetical protein